MGDKRQNVVEGGIFNLPKVVYSDSTKQLLRELAQEAAVVVQHRKLIEKSIYAGKILPSLQALSTTTHSSSTYGKLKEEFKGGRAPKLQRKRTWKDMERMGLFEPDRSYIPPPPKYGLGSKERCQDVMAYGKDLPIVTPKTLPSLPCSTPDRFDELLGEVEERLSWLQEMEKLGVGNKYHNIIEAQLALKLRDMELLDYEKAVELQRRLQTLSHGGPTKHHG
ncbi:UPF0193 protein EVG1 homolog [Oratosquilla oratoria]|uniref:UPF0193 protein EVG1 homolog n=1 Tax=Oratosquilla oratoria TaxID=337810 RepID=UPI003F77091F